MSKVKRSGFAQLLVGAIIPLILALILAVIEYFTGQSLPELIMNLMGGEQTFVDSVLVVPTSQHPIIYGIDIWRLMMDGYDKLRSIGMIVLGAGLMLAALSFTFENVKLLPEKWSMSIVRSAFWVFIIIMIFPDLWSVAGEFVNYISLPDNKIILSGGELANILNNLGLTGVWNHLKLNFNLSDIGQSIIAVILAITLEILSIGVLLVIVALGAARILLLTMAFLLFPVAVALSIIPYIRRIIEHVNEILLGMLLSPMLSSAVLYAGSSILQAVGQQPILALLVAYTTLTIAVMTPVLLVRLLGSIYTSIKSGIDMATSAAVSAVMGGITAAGGYLLGMSGVLGGAGGMVAQGAGGTVASLAASVGGEALTRAQSVVNARQNLMNAVTTAMAVGATKKPSLKTRLKQHAKYLPLAVLSGMAGGFAKGLGLGGVDPSKVGSVIGGRAGAKLATVAAFDEVKGELAENFVYYALSHDVTPNWDEVESLMKWYRGELSDDEVMPLFNTLLGRKVSKEEVQGFKRGLKVVIGPADRPNAGLALARFAGALRDKKNILRPGGNYGSILAMGDAYRAVANLKYGRLSPHQINAIYNEWVKRGINPDLADHLSRSGAIRQILNLGEHTLYENMNKVLEKADEIVKKANVEVDEGMAYDIYKGLLSMDDETVGKAFANAFLGDALDTKYGEIKPSDLMLVDYESYGKHMKKVVEDLYKKGEYSKIIALDLATDEKYYDTVSNSAELISLGDHINAFAEGVKKLDDFKTYRNMLTRMVGGDQEYHALMDDVNIKDNKIAINALGWLDEFENLAKSNPQKYDRLVKAIVRRTNKKRKDVIRHMMETLVPGKEHETVKDVVPEKLGRAISYYSDVRGMTKVDWRKGKRVSK